MYNVAVDLRCHPMCVEKLCALKVLFLLQSSYSHLFELYYVFFFGLGSVQMCILLCLGALLSVYVCVCVCVCVCICACSCESECESTRVDASECEGLRVCACV